MGDDEPADEPRAKRKRTADAGADREHDRADCGGAAAETAEVIDVDAGTADASDANDERGARARASAAAAGDASDADGEHGTRDDVQCAAMLQEEAGIRGPVGDPFAAAAEAHTATVDGAAIPPPPPPAAAASPAHPAAPAVLAAVPPPPPPAAAAAPAHPAAPADADGGLRGFLVYIQSATAASAFAERVKALRRVMRTADSAGACGGTAVDNAVRVLADATAEFRYQVQACSAPGWVHLLEEQKLTILRDVLEEAGF